MQAGRRLLALVGLVGTAVVVTAVALAATASWGTAIEVPGSAALNLGGRAGVVSISCASAGSCAAGGGYTDASGHVGQPFVVNQTNGVWGAAITVPGLAGLSRRADTRVREVSCATAGSCAAGGFYRDAPGKPHAFLVDERHGVWGKAVEVPGLPSRSVGSWVSSISCARPGFCAAGGSYLDAHDNAHAFLVNERNGVWHEAIGVLGSSTPNRIKAQEVTSISCATAGSCAAGGYGLSVDYKAFVVNEKNGVWGKAKTVSGSATFNVGGDAAVYTISCAAKGSCAAGGYYTDGHNKDHAFVVNETKGVWRRAIEVPGSAGLNRAEAEVYSISCAAAGSCAAGGYYLDGSQRKHAFVVNEKRGIWHKAKGLPILRDAEVDSVSCAKAGSCAAGGRFVDSSGAAQAFVVGEKYGVWAKAKEVPGTAALNLGGVANVWSISCAEAGLCAAGGSYRDSDGNFQAFVTAR